MRSRPISYDMVTKNMNKFYRLNAPIESLHLGRHPVGEQQQVLSVAGKVEVETVLLMELLEVWSWT